ncbi:MAG: ceramidase domain-containing protein [Myxococcota bacterium]
MDWNRSVDQYCERVGPELWSEPLNLLSNLAFLYAAVVHWPSLRVEGPVWFVRWLALLVLVTGVGSGLFHSFATVWALLADVVPIALFVCSYMAFVARTMWGCSLLGTACSVVGLLVLSVAFGALPAELFNGSNLYFGAALALTLAAFVQARSAHCSARPLRIAAAIFPVSLLARTIDAQLCSWLPLGTHFIWHLLNGAVCYYTLAAAHTYLQSSPGFDVPPPPDAARP